MPDVLQMVWYTGHNNTHAYLEKQTAPSNVTQQSQFRPRKRLQLLPMSRPPLICFEIRVVPKDNIALHFIRRLILIPSRWIAREFQGHCLFQVLISLSLLRPVWKVVDVLEKSRRRLHPCSTRKPKVLVCLEERFQLRNAGNSREQVSEHSPVFDCHRCTLSFVRLWANINGNVQEWVLRNPPYQHRMTRISQQSYASRVVSPLIQGLPVHQAPVEGGLDESEKFADSIRSEALNETLQELDVPSHRGSKSSNSCLILSVLPSAVQDSTDPSSWCNRTRL